MKFQYICIISWSREFCISTYIESSTPIGTDPINSNSDEADAMNHNLSL